MQKTDPKQRTKSPAKEPKPKPGPGRPTGAASREYPVVDAQPTACPRTGCGSTERSQYIGTHKKLVQHMESKVVVTQWKRCYCLKCGQYRMDKYRTESVAETT